MLLHLENSRLAMLMNIFNVTGRDLAKVLHVDYSLISKWKNNKRHLSQHSVHLKKLVRYFLTLDTPNKYSTLKAVLMEKEQAAGLDTPEEVTAYLGQWLSNSIAPDNRNGVLSRMQQSSNYTASFNVYSGDTGRRKAVLKFLDEVLALQGGQHLLLVSEEDMSWLVGDSNFLNAWKEKLTAVLMKKNRITIIHTVDRDYQSLAPIIAKWLPLHLTGMIESYYLPKYVDKSFKTTLFILQNRTAVTGMTVEGFSKARYTTFYFDPATVRQCELIYRAFVAECCPLFEVFWPDRQEQLFRKIVDTETDEGSSYLFSPLPSFATMSRETLTAILKENNLIDECTKKYLAWHEQVRKGFFKNLSKYCQRHILSIDLLEQAKASDETIYADLSQLAGMEIKASAINLSRHIQDILTLLEKHPKFDIALVPSQAAGELQGISVWVKESAVMTAYANVKKIMAPLAVLTEEPTIIDAFFQYHHSIWNSIPRIRRNKDWVRNKLASISYFSI